MSAHALVLGGTGVVGGAAVRALAAAGHAVTFTFHQRAEAASALAAEIGASAIGLDLRDAAATRSALDALAPPPSVLVHAAGRLDARSLAELDVAAFDEAYALEARSAFVAVRALAPRMAEAGGGRIVLVGALDRTQSLPVPLGFAASQGMLAAMVMALGRELAPLGVTINMLALGLLDAGLSLGLGEGVRDDYLAFSALRRFGTPAEAGAAIRWLALEAPTYLTGKVVPVNGGV